VTAASATRSALAPLRVKGCCQPVAASLPDARAHEFAAIYKALGDPTRIQILHILATASEPVCVCDFTAAFELGQPTISHHLATLREAGIVTSFKRGIWAFYRLNPAMSAVARAAVAQVS
jgi:ArsR family transcriptional regulator, arsenate/arsenite/antimonite-responsive transcriptional repressor